MVIIEIESEFDYDQNDIENYFLLSVNAVKVSSPDIICKQLSWLYFLKQWHAKYPR